jgi:hypothetical protein
MTPSLSDVDEDPGESKSLRHENSAVTDELLTAAEKWLEDVKRP